MQSMKLWSYDIHLWHKHVQETGIENFQTDNTMSPCVQAPAIRTQLYHLTQVYGKKNALKIWRHWGLDAQCVLNKRISREKAGNSCSFPSTTAHCSTLASFQQQLVSLVRIYVCASARTHCATILSTVRYGKCNQRSSIVVVPLSFWTWSESQISVIRSVPFQPVLKRWT